ncbi:MAG: thiol oxidoreductase-like protein [Planctomycetaceae bacterium]|nr:thiol oxidoreductase-like protein [Planctomycetaceae bacterium]
MKRSVYLDWGLFSVFCIATLASGAYFFQQFVAGQIADHENRMRAMIVEDPGKYQDQIGVPVKIGVLATPSLKSNSKQSVDSLKLPTPKVIVSVKSPVAALPPASSSLEKLVEIPVVLPTEIDPPITVSIAAEQLIVASPSQKQPVPVPRQPADQLEKLKLAAGLELFVHRWEPHDKLAGGGDGLGPVFNGHSCVECHFQGGMGGGGSNGHNVQSFEILPNQFRPVVFSGVIHSFANELDLKESIASLESALNPGKIRVGQWKVRNNEVTFRSSREIDATRTVAINTPALWGLGLIDQISDQALMHLPFPKPLRVPSYPTSSNTHATSSHSHSKSPHATGHPTHFTTGHTTPVDSTHLQQVPPGLMVGRLRMLPKGHGKLGWKGQFATVHEFVAAACANELGLSNGYAAQIKPGSFQPDPQAAHDLNSKQVQALVDFVKCLPAPQQQIPDDQGQQTIVARGTQLFNLIGCANCHIRNVGPAKGVYSDFKLHKVVNLNVKEIAYYHDANLKLEFEPPQDYPHLAEWKTPPLWGVADTAPYWHDGSAKTLEDAILAHADEAQPVTMAFCSLNESDQDSVIAFLETLRAPQNLPPIQTLETASR